MRSEEAIWNMKARFVLITLENTCNGSKNFIEETEGIEKSWDNVDCPNHGSVGVCKGTEESDSGLLSLDSQHLGEHVWNYNISDTLTWKVHSNQI